MKILFQQHAPTSELMMLDRLRVADLKDEIVSMQAELNSVLFEQHQKTQIVVKTEVPSMSSQAAVGHVQHQQPQIQQMPQLQNIQTVQTHVVSQSQQAPRIQTTVKIMQEPSQILKAKQEQKLFENIKNERVKIEIPEPQKEPIKSAFGFASTSGHFSLAPKPPIAQKQSKFDKLKNESLNMVSSSHSQHSHALHNKSQQQVKSSSEMKQELDDFDVESEIRPNLIMKKCESVPAPPTVFPTVAKKQPKQREKEREFSPLSEYFNPKVTATSKNKTELSKTEGHDGSFDEWLSIQKELNLQITSSISTSSVNKKKDNAPKGKKILDNDLSEMFEHHTSPKKSVEKQLDDLFSSTSKSSDLLAAASPLTEFFHVEPSGLNEKTVENRLEALFGGSEDDSGKSNQQDLVETRLEQLFQGSVAENDESALDNASFLYKNTDMTYDMIQKQIQVATSLGDNGSGSSSNSNKRQWNNTCDLFTNGNPSMLFPSSSSPPTSAKRPCTAAPPVAFDNKWIEDSFDFATEIMSTETSGDDIEKHRSWNGSIDHRETMIGGIQSPHQSQFHMSTSETSNIQQHQSQNQTLQQNDQHMNLVDRQDHLMDGQMTNLNYDDVDDISRQVQNAIDSILNLQSTDPLHYQLDSSFLELNSITAPSGAPNSPINHHQSHSHQIQNPQHIGQYHNQRNDHQVNTIHGFSNQKPSNMPKRKYSRMDDIGDCLIGGSNLDDSPSALALNEAHGVESSSAGVGEFVNNLLNCEDKSITTS